MVEVKSISRKYTVASKSLAVVAGEGSSGRKPTVREGRLSSWMDSEVAMQVGLYIEQRGLWKWTLKKI